MHKQIFKILIIVFLLVPAMLCPFSARADAGPVPFVGEIRLFAFDFPPNDYYWVPADGRTLPIEQYELLFSVIGNNYGGDGMTNFAIPNLNGEGGANPLGTGKGRYFIAVNGVLPSSDYYADVIKPYTGEIRLFLYSPTTAIPKGWLLCNGDMLPTSEERSLYTYIGHMYGGSGSQFALPDLRGLEPVPGSRYCICTSGYTPNADIKREAALASAYIGEIRLVAFNFTPDQGWLRCNGQSTSASSHSKLYSLLGTMYGGDGDNFLLPDLDGGSVDPQNSSKIPNLWGWNGGWYCIVADEQFAVLPTKK